MSDDRSELQAGPPTDEVGRPVPAALVPVWADRKIIEAMIGTVHGILGCLDDGIRTKDPLYAGVNLSPIVNRLTAVSSQLSKEVLPFAVCPYCQGNVTSDCRLCRGRGLVSEHQWKVCVPEELKRICQSTKSVSRSKTRSSFAATSASTPKQSQRVNTRCSKTSTTTPTSGSSSIGQCESQTNAG